MTKHREKGVVLFIVEGISDKIALSLPMTELISNARVHFCMVNGDCLNRTEASAVQVLQAKVRDCMVKYGYRKSDFSQIIHIIDTDGSFIPDSRVYKGTESGVEYYTDHIETGVLNDTIARHHRRTHTAHVLSQTKTILGIPYDIYFMSRNLEHVTQGDGGKVTNGRKIHYAEHLADRYAYDPYAFWDMLYREKVTAQGDYADSWKYIMTGTNSLLRLTNLNIFFDRYVSSLEKL